MQQQMASFTLTISFAFLLLALAPSSFITVEGTQVPAIFVFGDSLVDVGNNNYLNLPLSYKSNFWYNGIDFPGQVPTGRFSNGFNGPDYVAMNLGFEKGPPPYLSIKNVNQMWQGVNFASGGSGILQTTGNGTLTMATQVNYFAHTKEALAKRFGGSMVNDSVAKSLFYIATASNDLFEYYTANASGAANSTANTQFISSLVDEFLRHLMMLYKLGARKFAITGTGILGCVPFLRNLNPTGGCFDELNQISVQFNAVAATGVQQLSHRLAGFNYSYMPLYNVSTAILAAPDAFGFKELNSACCGAGKFNGAAQCTPNATYCSNRKEYFFWDWSHPTQSLYNILAHFHLYDSTSLVLPINIKQLVA